MKGFYRHSSFKVIVSIAGHFQSFERIAETSIEKFLVDQFSGCTYVAFKTIVAFSRDPVTYWAEQLYNTQW